MATSNQTPIHKLQQDEIQNLTMEQIKALTKDEIQALTPIQIGWLKPTQVDYITDDQINYLTDQQIQSFTNNGSTTNLSNRILIRQRYRIITHITEESDKKYIAKPKNLSSYIPFFPNNTFEMHHPEIFNAWKKLDESIYTYAPIIPDIMPIEIKLTGKILSLESIVNFIKSSRNITYARTSFNYTYFLKKEIDMYRSTATLVRRFHRPHVEIVVECSPPPPNEEWYGRRLAEFVINIVTSGSYYVSTRFFKNRF